LSSAGCAGALARAAITLLGTTGGFLRLRILVAIPHYFRVLKDGAAIYSSQIEPLGRIAALNGAIVALHRNFGPERHTLDGTTLPDEGDRHILDIVIVVSGDDHVLAECGLDAPAYSIERVGGDPTLLPFHASRILGERSGAYDFYCYLEDDLIIHDREFFTKLVWFQHNFGAQAVLMPVRFEMSSRGIPAKVVIDSVLPEEYLLPFRRPNQRIEISAAWHESMQTFEIPDNPHAASYFLSQEQMSYWMRQPSFSDRDKSWIGPLESAATFAIGRTFDIYKSSNPDPFFLEIEHYGTRYAQRHSPQGERYGDPPLLAIAQNALRELDPAGAVNSNRSLMLRQLVEKGSTIDQLNKLQRVQAHLEQTAADFERRTRADLEQARADLARAEADHRMFRRSRRLLLKALLKAVYTGGD
jgi:hypothetical protein